MARYAFLFGPMSAGTRPFDFSRIDDDPRGLTGTDNSFLGYASAMAELGHEVDIFCALQRFRIAWRGCIVKPYEERRSVDASYDAALSWNDVAPLSDVSPECLRVLNLQINDFSYTKPEQHESVDLYVAPSKTLAERLEMLAPKPKPWRVVPNGCDPTAYTPGIKVPGLCIYASSADRGLHVVLEQWPRIKERVPWAHLKIFYHSLQLWFSQIAGTEHSPQWNEREQGRRAKLVRDLLPTLEQDGVEVVGSVSRREMALEYSKAMCVVGPTTTVSFTEGFGVAVLEGCAAGAIPCISTVDAFGEVYEGACPMVDIRKSTTSPPWRAFDEPALRQEWEENVVRALTDGDWREEWRVKGDEFASRNAWPQLARKLEGILVNNRKGASAA